ncbi:hypothetical protein L1987_57880 [Smallanthus sonchifolius]|uniref:Uncharacterized protein n=1 Tax=Smallanthus sonchifolius TaxID=185202 RepID=A0ACB9DDR2_9ASTR|nr:hypothetical protein L1987_57880 [Smallanthus sonchifolius]
MLGFGRMDGMVWRRMCVLSTDVGDEVSSAKAATSSGSLMNSRSISISSIDCSLLSIESEPPDSFTDVPLVLLHYRFDISCDGGTMNKMALACDVMKLRMNMSNSGTEEDDMVLNKLD